MILQASKVQVKFIYNFIFDNFLGLFYGINKVLKPVYRLTGVCMHLIGFFWTSNYIQIYEK